MALTQRIASLQKLHDETDMKIRAMLAHPSVEDDKIKALKQERLGYKDSIVRLLLMNDQQHMGERRKAA